jgi:hypothetical protein
MRSLSPFVVVLLFVAPLAAADTQVTIQYLGGAKKVPLEGITVSLYRSTGSYSEDMRKPPIQVVTDKSGTAGFTLAAGHYHVRIESKKEYPYLTLPVGYHGHPNHYGRMITVGAHVSQSFTFNLADACKLTLKAVDADTGKGIPGVLFATENSLGEVWGISILSDTLGAKSGKAVEDERSDANGAFTRLVGPRPGYTYYPWLPKGYMMVGTHELELETPVGKASVEHVFKMRKVK